MPGQTEITIPEGRIDLHSHVLPGIDDGCADLNESLQSVQRLKTAGFVATVCTPHIWPETYPHITSEHIAAWIDALQREFDDRGIEYRLLPGGELRLHRDVIAWLKDHPVPTLGDSRYVLVDFWEDRWPRWVDKTIDWLLDEGYKPILAHPERVNIHHRLERQLDRLVDQGVLLQANLGCFSGAFGALAQQRVRQFFAEGRYHLLALDMHRPDALEPRLEGLNLAADQFGADVVDSMIVDRPRRILLDQPIET